MPLDADRWGQAIADAIAGASVPQTSFLTPTELADLWKLIAGEHTGEVTTNALVNVTSVTGVTSGGDVSGPGTGTIS